jgi:hypothetical protein
MHANISGLGFGWEDTLLGRRSKGKVGWLFVLISDMSRFEEWEINKYWEIFSGLDPVGGLLSGDKVATVLKNSQLPDDQLEKIWDLSDIDSDGNLDFEEFCIAMRLIFDMINGTYTEVPDELPEWLVPSSKAHLVAANQAVKSGGASGGGQQYDYDDDSGDELGLSSDFNWYISREDRETYSDIYSANADRRGLVSFDALTELYQTLENVPETDIRSAWNLVNPRSDEKIEREQCVVFLHILNNRSKGVRVPRSVPASLRATFEKAKPTYDINKPATTYTPPKGSTSSKKSAFAEGYLSRLGLGGRSQGYDNHKGTDFSSTKNTDWEEVRLKRELTDLENQIERAQEAADRRKKGVEDYGSSKSALIRRELEQLLDYKERQLQRLRTGDLSNESNPTDLAASNEEIDLISQQVKSLQEHQQNKQRELEDLKAQAKALAT